MRGTARIRGRKGRNVPCPAAGQPDERIAIGQLYAAPPILPVKLTAIVVPRGKAFGWGTAFTVEAWIHGNGKRSRRSRTTVGRWRYRNGTGHRRSGGVGGRKRGNIPTPEPPKPMEGVLLFQLNVVPVTAPAKLTAAVDEPAHKV